MAEHGYVVDHLRMPYPELQTSSLESTIVPGLMWLESKFDRPIIIDDSGLFIDSLKGFPGVYSSYAFKTLGCEGILELMRGVGERAARFECCIGFISPEGEPFIAKGVAEGSIAEAMRGSGGFGYDPIFVHEGHSLTYAEMDVIEKNKISHRGIAMEKLIEALPDLLPTP